MIDFKGSHFEKAIILWGMRPRGTNPGGTVQPMRGYPLIAALLLSLLTAPALGADRPRSFVILAINDVYRIGGVEGGSKGGLGESGACGPSWNVSIQTS